MRFRKKRKIPKGTNGGEFSNKCCLSFDFHPRRFFSFHETQQSVFVKSSMNLNYKILHVNRWVKIMKHHITDGISSFPATGLDRPLGFQQIEATEFLDNRHMKVVRLSALRTDCLYPQEWFLVLISVRGWPEESHWKIPVTPSGIEPATSRFLAQYLNQMCHRITSKINRRCAI